MKLSIIDIGTQSIKHYIFDKTGTNKKLIHYKRYSEANLGESNIIIPKTINRNIEILKQCINFNEEENVSKLHLIGTEILRKANNANEFLNKVYEISNEKVEVISHKQEAKYLYQGFLDIIPNEEKFGAINIGGGTTELIVGNSSKLEYSLRLPFGVKFIRNKFGEHDTINWDELDKFLDNEIQINEKVNTLFITGVLDFIKTIENCVPFGCEKLNLPEHPIMLTMDDWKNWIDIMRLTPLEKQKQYYSKDPNFCDGTTIGHSVYYIIAKKLGVKKVIPSRQDLTDGIIYEMSKIK